MFLLKLSFNFLSVSFGAPERSELQGDAVGLLVVVRVVRVVHVVHVVRVVRVVRVVSPDDVVVGRERGPKISFLSNFEF